MKNWYSKKLIYDYTSKKEAEKHIKKMIKKGYQTIPQRNGKII